MHAFETTWQTPASRGVYGAIFDWDGVVIDSSSAHEESWERLAALEGLPLPDGHFQQGFGKRNQVIIPSVYQWADDPDEVQRLGERKEALYREILTERGLQPLPGVRALLRDLHEAGIPCAIGTSTPRANIDFTLDMLELHDYFQAAVTAEDVSHGKPEPEVFLKCAAALGRAPERCVVFEDARYGIEAGLRGGFKVVAVATTHPIEELGEAHWAVPSLEDVDLKGVLSLIDRIPA
jgi:beta-phosphoglucomutase family hydrolase